jgi:hypothetical protein
MYKTTELAERAGFDLNVEEALHPGSTTIDDFLLLFDTATGRSLEDRDMAKLKEAIFHIETRWLVGCTTKKRSIFPYYSYIFE